MEEETDRCPYCGGTRGYRRESMLLHRYYYGWDGGRICEMEPLHRCPSVTYCMDCGRKLNGGHRGR